MNTRQKGDQFESLVYRELERELSAGRLGVAAESAKLFRGKRYRSRDRDGDIVTDLSIEIHVAGRERPAILWIFECKDYRRPVPVDELEEFHAKIEQIGQDNTKGTFVTTFALQRGALAYARSKGIGVVRVMPSRRFNRLDYLLESPDGLADRVVDPTASEIALTDPDHLSQSDIAGEHGGQFFSSWRALLGQVGHAG